MRRLERLAAAATMALLAALQPTQARASLQITITVGSNTPVVLTSTSAGVSDSTTNGVETLTYNPNNAGYANIDGFRLSLTYTSNLGAVQAAPTTTVSRLGTSDSYIGNVNAGSGAMITIDASDTTFTYPGRSTLAAVTSTVSANTFSVTTGPDSISFRGEADPGKQYYGSAATTSTYSATPSSTSPTTLTPGGFANSNGYSITSHLQATLDTGAATSLSATTSVVPTPEPGTLVLVAAGLPGAILLARRRRAGR